MDEYRRIDVKIMQIGTTSAKNLCEISFLHQKVPQVAGSLYLQYKIKFLVEEKFVSKLKLFQNQNLKVNKIHEILTKF